MILAARIRSDDPHSLSHLQSTGAVVQTIPTTVQYTGVAMPDAPRPKSKN